MPVTFDDIENFKQFARNRLENGGAESLAKLVDEWEAQHREYDQTVADVCQGQVEYEAGKGKPVADVFARVRKQIGLNE